MNRRHFLLITAATSTAILPALSWAAEKPFEITRSEAEWRALLTGPEYAVTREDATERAGSSLLDGETRAGIYDCRGCDLPLYASSTKYDSGTGWPSFTAALPDAVRTKPDRFLFSVRTEVHCRRCGSHLGHIFDDGPEPAGKRHCLNGVSLRFRAA